MAIKASPYGYVGSGWDTSTLDDWNLGGGSSGAGTVTGGSYNPNWMSAMGFSLAPPPPLTLNYQPYKGPNPYAGLISQVRGSIPTQQGMLRTASTQARAWEQATLAAAKAASDKIIAQYNNQSNRAQGFARALATLQNQQDEQAYARYSDAASRMQGLGAGLAGATAGAYQEAVNRTQGTLDQLTGGAGGAIEAPSAADIRNASQYAGVTIPAGSLQESALNAAALAKTDAAARAFGINLIGNQYQAKADEAISQAAADARSIIGQRPQNIQQYLSQLQANRAANVNTLASLIGAGETVKQTEQKRLDDITNARYAAVYNQWKDTNTLRTTMSGLANQLRLTSAQITGFDPVTGLPTFANRQYMDTLTQNKQTMAQNWSKTAGMVYEVKPDGSIGPKVVNGHVVPIGGYHLDPRNPMQVVPTYAPGRGGKTTPTTPGTGGMTTKEWGKLVSQGQDKADTLMGIGADVEWQWQPPIYDNGELVQEGAWKSPPGANPVDYPTLLRSLLGMNDSPRWQKRATALAQSYFDPGQGGRPWGTGAEAKRYITQAVRSAKNERIPYNKVLTDLLGMGLNRNQIEKELKRVFGNVRVWKPSGGVTGRPEHSGGNEPTLVRPAWDPKKDPPVQPVAGDIRLTKNGYYVNIKTGKYTDRQGNEIPGQD